MYKRQTLNIIKDKYFDPVRNDLNRKYDYQEIPTMICGDLRIRDDSLPIKAEYKNNINDRMMEIAFHWLNEVLTEYHLTPQTMFYTRNIIDKYLFITNSIIERKDLQLLGITALFIASKIFDTYTPGIGSLEYITDHSFTENQIIAMEKDIVYKLKFQLMFPNIHEYIYYYNEGTLKSVISDCEILGRILMIDSSIPNNYSNHDIAAALVYIVAKGNNESPKCLAGLNHHELSELIITSIKRIKSKFSFEGILSRKERIDLDNILARWEIPTVQPVSPILMRKAVEGVKLSIELGITFTAIKDEDVTRENFGEYVNEYVMTKALNYSNYGDFDINDRNKFAKYFEFKLAPNGRYGIGKDKLDKISYDLGKFTVETSAKVNFNNVPSELQRDFKKFFDVIQETSKFSTMDLFGTVHVIKK